MPGCAALTPYDIDPRRWDRCRKQAAATMVAAGWQPYARKFSEVHHRKAMKLFYAR